MARGMWWMVVLGAVVVTGCGSWNLRRSGSTTAVPSTEAGTAQPYVWQEEGSFPDPPPVEAEAAGETLRGQRAIDDSLQVPDSEGSFAAVDSGFSVEALPPVEPPPQLAAAESARPTAVPGYRVQVFATRSREAAERLRGELQQSVSMPTYVDFDDPYFKVRVGDCSNEGECRLLQEQLRSFGYPAAFVIPAPIVAP